MSASESPVGCYGRVTSTGAIRPGKLGEVMVSIRGGVEAFLARDIDGGAIDPYEEVVVVEYEPPRTVLVTRLYQGTGPNERR
jgi:hypothetical protein